MKFATGLVLAALAVTAANAGNPNYLRATKTESASDDFDFSDSLDASGSSDCPEDCPDKYKPVKDSDGVEYPNECFMRMAQCTDASGSLGDLADLYGGSVDEDDLTIDLTDLFGSDSTDGSHVKVNIMSLIGSGSDQVDMQDIIDAFEEEDGSDDSESGSDDLSWLFDSDSDSGSDDDVMVKGGKKTPVYDDSDSDEDDVMVKGGKKTPVYDDDSDSGEDDVLVKGGKKTPIVDDDSDSGEDDILVKGGSKTPATKSGKATKASKTDASADTIGSLYEDGSEGIIGDESESDEEDPTLVKGATKGKTVLDEDDSKSASDEDDDQTQNQQTAVATKSSKTLLP
ncbi:unnamed protein product [Phytophthora lilii]|uniref:Unnamed protein product n=1 Tax=Phytophthora lilii TaxID=2077276 RepID=A0A9W6U972_9STRA|nr:unnamed protein product [Phytophthora lilii]